MKGSTTHFCSASRDFFVFGSDIGFDVHSVSDVQGVLSTVWSKFWDSTWTGNGYELFCGRQSAQDQQVGLIHTISDRPGGHWS